MAHLNSIDTMKKQLQSLALTFALTALPATAAVVSTYAVDFHGTVQPDTLAPTDVAGVVPTTRWDAATGLSGGGSTLTNTGIGGSMSYGWNAPMDGLISPSSSTVGDEDMMEGYLTTRNLMPSITVQFSIPTLASLGWDEYDLYIYTNAGSSDTYGIDLFLGGAGIPISYTHNDLAPGYGGGTSTYVDSQTSPSGNYVVYTGLVQTTQFIEISTTSEFGGAYANGFQIVGRTIPEPTTGLLALLGLLPLFVRRRNS